MAGIILAAGEASRMGRAKQLLPAGDETLLQRVLREALASGLETVVLVLGHRADQVRESMGRLQTHPKLRIVVNPRFREGMSTSLIEGMRCVEGTCERVMVILGDMPQVTSNLIDRLRRETEISGRPLGAVAVRGRRTLPVVIGRAFYEKVHGLTGDVGARGLFRDHPGATCLVETGDTYESSDIDTPEDYERFIHGLGGGKGSSKAEV